MEACYSNNLKTKNFISSAHDRKVNKEKHKKYKQNKTSKPILTSTFGRSQFPEKKEMDPATNTSNTGSFKLHFTEEHSNITAKLHVNRPTGVLEELSSDWPPYQEV